MSCRCIDTIIEKTSGLFEQTSPEVRRKPKKALFTIAEPLQDIASTNSQTKIEITQSKSSIASSRRSQASPPRKQGSLDESGLRKNLAVCPKIEEEAMEESGSRKSGYLKGLSQSKDRNEGHDSVEEHQEENPKKISLISSVSLPHDSSSMILSWHGTISFEANHPSQRMFEGYQKSSSPSLHSRSWGISSAETPPTLEPNSEWKARMRTSTSPLIKSSVLRFSLLKLGSEPPELSIQRDDR